MKNPLGENVVYPDSYDSALLFPIPRSKYREALLPSFGFDLWQCYEFSWLELSPQAGILQIVVPAESPNIIESKSLKLYLGSFANSRFASIAEVERILESDLAAALGIENLDLVIVEPKDWNKFQLAVPSGVSIDNQELEIKEFQHNSTLLRVDSIKRSHELLYTDLLRTLCPVTGQPDWATVQIEYNGPQINHESLLRYFASFRNHTGFHEHCTEAIFSELSAHCQPEELTVSAHFTRRGGIDINPVRTKKALQTSDQRRSLYRPSLPKFERLTRQ
jgi:7-cyano-7-deazaguanine reductase